METMRELSMALTVLIGTAGLGCIWFYLVLKLIDKVIDFLNVRELILDFLRHRKEFKEWLKSRHDK